MIHLKTIAFAPPPAEIASAHPFSVPAVAGLAGASLTLERDVTFLIGENGSGKSTLLESLACAVGSIAVAADEVERDATLAAPQALAATMRLSWRKRTRAGFFMRSEDFFGFTRRLRRMREELLQELNALDETYATSSEYARTLARQPFVRELAAMQERYGDDLDARSHGESYFTLFKARFVPNGLYLLDEPEAPLSPLRQIAFLSLIKEAVEQHGAQFVIATHSPIIMAYPGAAILCCDGGTVHPLAYDDVEHVRITKAFLQRPDQFLKHL
jgi:predicted ATPase